MWRRANLRFNFRPHILTLPVSPSTPPPPLVITVPVVLGTLSERCKGVVGYQYNADETSCCDGLKDR